MNMQKWRRGVHIGLLAVLFSVEVRGVAVPMRPCYVVPVGLVCRPMPAGVAPVWILLDRFGVRA